MRWYSIQELMPSFADGQRGIVIKSYIDTGNQFDSTTSTLVTVALCCAHGDRWRELETRWMEIISEAWSKCFMPPEVPFLHTTDMMAGAEPFTLNNGWSRDTSLSLMEACANAMVAMSDEDKLHMVTCSAWLSEYKKVADSIPEFPHLIDQMAMWCVARVAITDDDEFIKDGMALFFDRSEKLYGALKHRYENNNAKLAFPWNQVTLMGNVPSKTTPGIQFADLLAWSLNASYEGRLGTLWQEHLFSRRRWQEMLDERKFRAFAEDGSMERFNADIARPKRRQIP